jgi:outer membrane protein assembly factor BamA
VINSKAQTIEDSKRKQRRWLLWRACLSALLSIPLAGICTYSAESNEPDVVLFGRIIREISFSSDLPLDHSHFDSRLGIKPGDLLTRTGVKGAIQSLYESGRFSQVVVDASPTGDYANICFRVRHNYYFNKFSISGNVDLKQRSLWELVSLPIGQRFTPQKLEESRGEVLRFMRDRGFYLAEIKAQTAADEKTRQVDTVFEVKPGTLATIRSVDVKGVPSPGSEELRYRLGFRKGRIFDRSRLNTRLENLRKYFTDKGYLAAVAEV